MNSLAAVPAAVFLVGLVTKVIDWVRNGLDNADSISKFWWQAASFALGTAVAWGAHLNLLPAIASALHLGNIATSGWLERVIDGFLLGSGSSVLHDIIDGGAPAPTPKGLRLHGGPIRTSKKKPSGS